MAALRQGPRPSLRLLDHRWGRCSDSVVATIPYWIQPDPDRQYCRKHGLRDGKAADYASAATKRESVPDHPIPRQAGSANVHRSRVWQGLPETAGLQIPAGQRSTGIKQPAVVHRWWQQTLSARAI